MLKQNDKTMNLCEEVSEIVIETAKLAFMKDISITAKGQGNFVSSVDLKIEQVLKEELSYRYPWIGFITEEAPPEEKSEYNWIIDPIDGTNNFLNGFPFAVSLALEHKPSKDIILGIVYNPVDELLFYAVRGCGSYRVDSCGKKERNHVRKFEGNEGISIFGMPYNREKTNKILSYAAKYYNNSSDLKRIGPSSLDICRVASGQAKLYFELDLNVWDIAAGLLILEEAGGSYEKKDDLFLFYGAEQGKSLL